MLNEIEGVFHKGGRMARMGENVSRKVFGNGMVGTSYCIDERPKGDI